MLECVLELQFSCSSTAYLSVISLCGNFGVRGLPAPQKFIAVLGCNHRMSSVLLRCLILL